MSFNKNDVVIFSLTDVYIKPVISIWWAEISEKEAFTSQIKGTNNMSLAVECEGHLVGCLLASSIGVGLPLVKICLIHAAAVKPEYQKHGIGGMLINRLRDDCDARGITTIRALVPADNLTLKAYVEEWGFSPSNTINYDLPRRASKNRL